MVQQDILIWRLYGEWSSTFQFLGVKNGKKLKLIKCCDCGKDAIIDSSSRAIRCESCSTIAKQEQNRLRQQRFKKNNAVR